MGPQYTVSTPGSSNELDVQLRCSCLLCCESICYWCHPLIIFHSCFQYPAFYEGVFSSFMCCIYVHMFVQIWDCANTSARSFVCACLFTACLFFFVQVPILITSPLMLPSLLLGLFYSDHWINVAASTNKNHWIRDLFVRCRVWVHVCMSVMKMKCTHLHISDCSCSRFVSHWGSQCYNWFPIHSYLYYRYVLITWHGKTLDSIVSFALIMI